MLSFTFGGKNSYEDYGIVIAKRPNLPSPKRRVSYIETPGRNSSVRYDEKTYEDITLLIECGLKSIGDLINQTDEIKAWLFNTGESDLIFSFAPNKKYIAQVVNAIDFTQAFKYTSRFPIVFNCRPFKYASHNQEVTITNPTTFMNNPGSIESEPILKVYGEGDITLKINDNEINLIDIRGKIILNSTLEDCYNDAFENLNHKMVGIFPLLKVGQNQIQFTGNVNKLEILPNWRWL